MWRPRGLRSIPCSERSIDSDLSLNDTPNISIYTKTHYKIKMATLFINI